MTLPPCPDCGARVRLEYSEWDNPIMTPFRVVCSRASCGYNTEPCGTEDEAIQHHRDSGTIRREP